MNSDNKLYTMILRQLHYHDEPTKYFYVVTVERGDYASIAPLHATHGDILKGKMELDKISNNYIKYGNATDLFTLIDDSSPRPVIKPYTVKLPKDLLNSSNELHNHIITR